jgi:hypothetical protein
MKNFSILLMALSLAAAVHAEPAYTTRATDLQAQAQSDAATLVSLPENAKVDVLRRMGAWDEVKTSAGQTGWVRMLNLRFDSGSSKGSGAAGTLNALNGLLSTGRTSNTATVTTGARGLDNEDLQNATPNPAELEKMKQYAVTKEAAQSFARRSKLSAVQMDYLQESAATTAADSGMNGETH